MRRSLRSSSSHQPMSATCLSSSSYVRWSRSWSLTATASRSCDGEVGSPFGSAHDRSTPSSSSRRSKWWRGRWCSCSTKAGRASYEAGGGAMPVDSPPTSDLKGDVWVTENVPMSEPDRRLAGMVDLSSVLPDEDLRRRYGTPTLDRAWDYVRRGKVLSVTHDVDSDGDLDVRGTVAGSTSAPYVVTVSVGVD